MKETLQRIRAYIFRGWDAEVNQPHTRLKILPPFLLDLLALLLAGAILYGIGSAIWGGG